MLHTIEWHLETLPGSGIWTGSADHKKMTDIKGTSLLGGMRFWTEALLRSFGHHVCNSGGKEVFEKGKPEKICAACHSFGCTGLSRAFTLHVTPHGEVREQTRSTLRATPSPKGYYSIAEGWHGRVTLSLACRRPLSWSYGTHGEKGRTTLPPEVLLATLLMLEYGALGAHDQYGCGLVRLQNRDELLPLLRDCPLPEDGCHPPEPGLANLQDFFFFRGRLDLKELEQQSGCTVSNSGPPSLALVVRVRRLLRDSLREQGRSTVLRHWMCGNIPDKSSGTSRAKPVGSHISLGVSEGILYGWGWLPREGIADEPCQNWPAVRDETLNAVYCRLRRLCPELRWKEFSSSRDTCAPKVWREYVREMISRPWRDA